MSEPVNSDQRAWAPPGAASQGRSGDQTIEAPARYQQQRRPLPPRTGTPPRRQPPRTPAPAYQPPTAPAPAYQPPTTPAPTAYQQRPPQLQRPIYQQRLQYPQPGPAPYHSYRVPYHQALYYPPVLQYPSAPTQYASGAKGRSQSNRSTVVLLVGGGVVAVLIAVALGLGLAKFVHSNGNQLDVHQVEDGVRKILTESGYGYGVENVGAITCNNGTNPHAATGEGFTCNVVVDGANRRVAVVVVDDQGSYEVDRPR